MSDLKNAEKKIRLDELTVQKIQRMMNRGELSAVRLVTAYLERIEAIDRNGPRLNSMIELNPDALAEAARLDEERQQGQVRGAVHGIAVVLKDNIDTADRMTTTAGSLALEASIPRRSLEARTSSSSCGGTRS